MRAGLLVTLIAVVVLGFGAPSSAGVFPDLPGMKSVEKVTSGQAPSDSKSTSTGTSTSSKNAHVPAPDSKVDSLKTASKPLDPAAEIKGLHLPGTGAIPLLGKTVGSAQAFPIGLAVLALMFTVLWTRFLVRLNSFGRQS